MKMEYFSENKRTPACAVEQWNIQPVHLEDFITAEPASHQESLFLPARLFPVSLNSFLTTNS